MLPADDSEAAAIAELITTIVGRQTQAILDGLLKDVSIRSTVGTVIHEQHHHLDSVRVEVPPLPPFPDQKAPIVTLNVSPEVIARVAAAEPPVVNVVAQPGSLSARLDVGDLAAALIAALGPKLDEIRDELRRRRRMVITHTRDDQGRITRSVSEES